MAQPGQEGGIPFQSFQNAIFQLNNGTVVQTNEFLNQKDACKVYLEKRRMRFQLSLSPDTSEWILAQKALGRGKRWAEVQRKPAVRKTQCARPNRTGSKRRRTCADALDTWSGQRQEANGAGSSRSQQQQRVEEEEEEEEQAQHGMEEQQQMHVDEVVARMPTVNPDLLKEQLRADPAAALKHITNLLDAHHKGLRELSHADSSALPSCMDPVGMLEDMAVSARQLQDLQAPNMVIISGTAGAGKSTLVNSIIKSNLPANLVREDEPGPACSQGPVPVGLDTSPQGTLKEQRFLYSARVSLPHLDPVEEDHPWFSEEEDCMLPSGQNSSSVTGACVLTHTRVVDPVLGDEQQCNYTIQLELHSQPENTEAFLSAEGAFDGGQRPTRDDSGALDKACSILGLGSRTAALPELQDRLLPLEMRAKTLTLEVNARHPEAIAVVNRALTRLTCKSFWGAVKIAHLYVPGVKPMPDILDAPGLAFKEPYKLEVFQKAIRLYPVFAAIVVIKDRSGAASEDLATNMKELGLPGCLGAGSNIFGDTPMRIFKLYNVLDRIGSSMGQARFFGDNYHGPGASYRADLHGMIANSPGISNSTKLAMMSRAYTMPVFYTQDNLKSWIKKEDRNDLQPYLLERFWSDHLIPAWQEAQKLHQMALIGKHIELKLPKLFLDLDSYCNWATGSCTPELKGAQVVFAKLRGIINELQGSVQQCVSGRTRAELAKSIDVPDELRKWVASHINELLEDCSEEAVQKRARDAAREGNQTKFYCLVKPRSHQLNHALLTKPSESMPLGLLTGFALGSTMDTAAEAVGAQVKEIFSSVLGNFGGKLRGLVSKEKSTLLGAVVKKLDADLEVKAAREANAVKVCVQTVLEFTRTQLENAFAQVQLDLDKQIRFLQTSNTDAEGYFLRACDEAIHENAAKLHRGKKNNSQRIDEIAKQASNWGARLIDQITDHYVGSDTQRSCVWHNLCEMWESLSNLALVDAACMIEGLELGRDQKNCLSQMPLAKSFRRTRLMVAELLLELHAAKKQAGSMAALMDSLKGGRCSIAPEVGTASTSAASQSSSREAAAATPEEVRFCLERARGVVESEEGLAQASMQEAAQQWNAGQQQQQQQQQQEAGAVSAAAPTFKCCLCQKDAPQHTTRTTNLQALARRSPPVRQLAQGGAGMCWPCEHLLSMHMSSEGMSWKNQEAVKSAWDYVYHCMNSLRRTRRTNAGKRMMR